MLIFSYEQYLIHFYSTVQNTLQQISHADRSKYEVQFVVAPLLFDVV